MNIKDLIVPFALAVATTWAIQYFFFGKKEESLYRFTAPQSAVECVPLKKDVTFQAQRHAGVEKNTVVQTEWGVCEFSSGGAALTRLEFNHTVDGKAQSLTTIFPPTADDNINRAFLVALDQDTPFEYALTNRYDSDTATSLQYEARTQQGVVKKTFVVHLKKYQLDVLLELLPEASQTMRARIFYPAPIMPGLKDDVISADIVDGSDVFSKVAKDSLKLDEGWINPKIFGTEDKYFIHAMVNDVNSFAQRAYFNRVDQSQLSAIVEGPVVSQATQWQLSFYMGPKEVNAIRAVDARLEKALDYSGLLAPISRTLLYLLNLLNDYVHNYGLAIILLSLLIKLALLPLAIRAERSMKDRTEMQKRLAYIQQKYKDDPQGRAQAQAEFMQKNGLGLGGCLPMLLQVPVFFGLSRVLSSSIELYKAPFLWMSDLSARDPYYILPALVVVGMLSSAVNVPDSKQRIPVIAMAIGFGALSTSLAAGLVMYIAISTLLNMVQSYVLKWLRLA